MSLNQLKQLSVRDASLNLRCESINAKQQSIDNITVKNITITDSETINFTDVTQTSGAFGDRVDTTGFAPVITFPLATLHAQSGTGTDRTAIVIGNPNITVNSVIKATIVQYIAGLGSGMPYLFAGQQDAGAVELFVYNADTHSALNGILTVLVEILQPVA
jgi:hypothetical protein